MKKVIVFLILLSAIGCKRNQTFTSQAIIADMDSIASLQRVDTPYTVIDVENYKKIPYLEFHKFLKDVKYIPLKSDEPIGVIDVIKIHKGRVFILDVFKSESLFIFDMSTGDLIKRIHDKGQGPAEYLGLNDMTILNDQIVINDRLSFHTLYYTLDGEFIKKVRRIPNLYIEALNGTIVNQLTFGGMSDFNGNNTDYQLAFVLDDSIIIRKGFPYYPIQENAVNGKTFWRNNKDELLFSPLLSDTVYQFIDDSSYFIKYVVNQKKSLWGKHDEYLNFRDHSRLVIQEGYTFLGYEFLEVDNYVLYPIIIKINEFSRTDIHLYNKKTGLSFRTILDGEEGELPFTTFIKKAQNVYGNYFVSVFEEYEIEGMREFIKKDKKNLFQVQELKSILTSDIKDLECILVLYEFKDIDDIDLSKLID